MVRKRYTFTLHCSAQPSTVVPWTSNAARCWDNNDVRHAKEQRTTSRTQIVRDIYHAFASGERQLMERAFADEFSFSSPLDIGLDRAGYFDRCWPGAGQGQEFNFVRIVESGNEVVVTYEVKNVDGRRGRNTEIFTFSGDKIRVVEVYFGWTLP